MDYDKIILDLLNRIVTLEDKVARLEALGNDMHPDTEDTLAGSKKYRFLSDFLRQINSPLVLLSFSEIENILKFKLPDSAITHRAFWANTESHSIALSWLSVNYLVTEVNLKDKYIVFEKQRDFQTIKKSKSTAITEESYLCACKNYEMIALYENLKKNIFSTFEDVGIGATSSYIHWNVSGSPRTRQFANFYIQKEKIRILTLTPTIDHGVGEAVPDTHLWVLNYQTDIFSESDIDKVKSVILDSYNQVKQMV